MERSRAQVRARDHRASRVLERRAHLGPNASLGGQAGFTLMELMIVVAVVALLGAFLFSVGTRTYGGNSQNASAQVASALNFARIRSVSTRRIHQVEVKPNELLVWASNTTGFVSPGTCDDTTCSFVQRFALPNGTAIWTAETTLYPSPGNTKSKDDALSFLMTFKPDGSSTGGTIFVTDNQNVTKYRVLVYRATGSSHARKTW